VTLALLQLLGMGGGGVPPAVAFDCPDPTRATWTRPATIPDPARATWSRAAAIPDPARARWAFQES